MIYQDHSVSHLYSRPMESGNVGHSQRVKRRIHSRRLKRQIDPVILLSASSMVFGSDHQASFFDSFQNRFQAGKDRDGEKFPGICLLPFGISESQGGCLKINVIRLDCCLVESASGMEGDFEASQHPRRVFPSHSVWVSEIHSKLGDVVVCQFRFHLLSALRFAEFCDRVSLAEFAANGFLNQLSEELKLKERCVASDEFTVDIVDQAPCEIFSSMSILDLSGIGHTNVIEEQLERLPYDLHPSAGGLFFSVMRAEIFGDPCGESRVDAFDGLLSRSCFLCQALRLAGFDGIIGSITCGGFDPLPSIGVEFPQIPIRRAGMFSKGCHYYGISYMVCQKFSNFTVSHGLTWHKLFEVLARWSPWK